MNVQHMMLVCVAEIYKHNGNIVAAGAFFLFIFPVIMPFGDKWTGDQFILRSSLLIPHRCE